MPTNKSAAEYTVTSGIGSYVLLGALPGTLTFSEIINDEMPINYRASNGTKTEWGRGVFDLETNTLSRDQIHRSTEVGNGIVSWGSERKFVYFEATQIPTNAEEVFYIPTNIIQFGKITLPAEYGFENGPNNYLVGDAGNPDSDVSLLMRVNGNGRWEAGMVGDITEGFHNQSYHIKEVSGEYLEEVFQDRMVIWEPRSPRYPMVDFYAPDGFDNAIRVYGNSGRAILNLGNINEKEFPDGRGSGLQIMYNLDADQALIQAITWDAFYRNIVIQANHHKWQSGAVFLLESMELTDKGSLIVGDPIQLADFANVSNDGDAGIALMSSYVVGTILTALGGTGTGPTFTITHLQISSATITNPGSGGTDGSHVLTIVTGGTGTNPTFNGTIGGGVLLSFDSWINHGDLTTDPSGLTGRSITGSGLTGATATITVGVKTVVKTTDGSFTKIPQTPVATSDSGSGVGATLDITYQNGFGSINLLEVWIDGTKVIDSSGNWVGGLGSGGQVVANTNLTTSGAADLAQIIGRGVTDPNQEIQLGYRTDSDFGFIQAAKWGTAFSQVRINPAGGDVQVGATGVNIGFYGSSGAGIPTITGLKGGNAALGSLLTALASLGLIVDSSGA